MRTPLTSGVRARAGDGDLAIATTAITARVAVRGEDRDIVAMGLEPPGGWREEVVATEVEVTWTRPTETWRAASNIQRGDTAYDTVQGILDATWILTEVRGGRWAVSTEADVPIGVPTRCPEPVRAKLEDLRRTMADPTERATPAAVDVRPG